jgi:hypothetical protein
LKPDCYIEINGVVVGRTIDGFQDKETKMTTKKYKAMTKDGLQTLSPAELEVVDRAYKRWAKASPASDSYYRSLFRDYQKQGNFTICLLSDGAEFRMGVSKRNPTDEQDQSRAQCIALFRAARSLFASM